MIDSAVGYCRVSSEDSSTEPQRKCLVRWARINKIYMPNTFDEQSGSSSSIYTRKGLFSAVVCCLIEKIDTIVVQKIDILGTNEEIFDDLMKLCKRYGIKFYCLEEGLYLSSKMDRRKKREVRLIIRENEKNIEKNIELMKKGREIAMKNGVRMGRRPGTTKSDRQFLEEYKEVIGLLESGRSIRKTASLTGVSASTVQRIKKRFNIKIENEI